MTDLVGEGRRVCGMSHDELASYNHGRPKYERNVKYLPTYCFMASYVTTLLRDGFGFPTDENIHFVDEVGGYKVNIVLLPVMVWGQSIGGSITPLTCTRTSLKACLFLSWFLLVATSSRKPRDRVVMLFPLRVEKKGGLRLEHQDGALGADAEESQ